VHQLAGEYYWADMAQLHRARLISSWTDWDMKKANHGAESGALEDVRSELLEAVRPYHQDNAIRMARASGCPRRQPRIERSRQQSQTANPFVTQPRITGVRCLCS